MSSDTTTTTLLWSDPQRAQCFDLWLKQMGNSFGLMAQSVVLASQDASFRRYFRAMDQQGQSWIIMDAPPHLENCQPFVTIAALMAEAGLRVPELVHWDKTNGFLLLSDLGQHTMLTEFMAAYGQEGSPFMGEWSVRPLHEQRYRQALDVLLTWQMASRPNVLPSYDVTVLKRELQLYPDWYLAQHKQWNPTPQQNQILQSQFDLITQQCLSHPKVYVHRDFMPRNLMVHESITTTNTNTNIQPHQILGVLDFQDALYGPITYDIASLMRDAFVTWSEDFVIDITVRYWEKAKKKGLLNHDDWSQDFGAFFKAVEWMGLQRHLKVAGIFARLTLRDKKPKYLADTPRFLHYIRQTAHRYHELHPLLRLMDEVEGLQAASGWAFGRV